MDQPLVTSPPQASDERLAENAKNGDHASFEELVRRYQVPLLNFLQRKLPRADAEDILQDTFVRAYRRLDLYNSRWLFKTWIFTIASRLAINHFRKPWTEWDNSDSIPNLADDFEESRLEIDEQRDNLWKTARSALTRQQFDALWLFYVEDLPANQIAKILGRSWVSVKTMLHRARKRLKPLIAEEQNVQNGGPS